MDIDFFKKQHILIILAEVLKNRKILKLFFTLHMQHEKIDG